MANATPSYEIRGQPATPNACHTEMDKWQPVQALWEICVFIVQEETQVQDGPIAPNEIHGPRFADDQRQKPQKKVVFVIFEH